MIGRVIDARYELLERVSEGTFFTVYKGVDRVLNRPVAVKILYPRYAGSAEFTARLRAALSAASSLSHPGIARVYEVGESDGTVYVASEYVRGSDLKEQVRRSAPFSFSQAVEIAIRIAQALDYAHRAGFVHGDVTPYNVLVTPEMDVKLTDFGLRRAASASALIQSNAMLRGVHYLAREVAEGEEATPAADTYALGVILFEMLTGTLPYTGDTPLAVALKHAQGPVPSPRSVNPNVPRALEGIVMKALAKDPAQRYPSALAMMRDLRRAEECLRLGRPLSWSPAEAPAAAAAAEEEEEPRLGKRRDGWRVLQISLLCLVLGLAAGLAAFVFLPLGMPRDVVVPSIIGMPRAEAERLLQQAKLKMNVVQQQYSDEVPADHVIASVPEPGRQVTEGREIRVVLSQGPEMVTVPDVLHTSLAEARRLLQQANLETGTIREEFSDLVPRGQVIDQTPAADREVPKGSKVNLMLSLGAYVAPGTPVEEAHEPAEPPRPRPSPPPRQPQPRRSEPQRWEVSVEVPPAEDPEAPAQPVRIVVVEQGKEREAYNRDHPPADKFTTTVETAGRATIRVYIADKLVREEEVGLRE